MVYILVAIWFSNALKKSLDKILTPKDLVSIVCKMGLVKALLYLGKFSLQIHTRIIYTMRNSLVLISNLFSRLNENLVTVVTFKVKNQFLHSNIVCEFKAGGSSATYHGKTKPQFEIKM